MYNPGMDVCITCGAIIPVERIIALPETKTCAKCSTTPKMKGKMVFPHKTGSEVVIMPPEDFNNLNRLDRRRTQQHRRI